MPIRRGGKSMGGNQRFQRKPHVSIIFATEATSRIIPITKKTNTLQGTNISHLGKRKIIFKMPFLGGYVSSLEGIVHCEPNLQFWLPVFNIAAQQKHPSPTPKNLVKSVTVVQPSSLGTFPWTPRTHGKMKVLHPQ